ncbi:MAG: tRNA epoxyqueuosine(34) reductase QueG [Chloroflexi bacterium]|nr:tRNA epoxyqueuosine(34) reductase QueG [Chloroflexota bacterium]
MRQLKANVRDMAQALGFDLVGVARAEPLPEHRLIARERVRLGYLAGMSWFTHERVARASDPQALLPGARSVIVVGLSYLPPEESGKRANRQSGNNQGVCSLDQAGPDQGVSFTRGKVARYARWTDYHGTMKAKLHELAMALQELAGPQVKARVFVDDGALLERAYAERAGLGWFGRNTNILTQTHGSWVFLGALVTDLELEPDTPLKKSCGECTRCIPACPTGAIVAPYAIDARRCISYLTIEHRGPIPLELRSLMGDWVFGCDLCQEVCPVNRDARSAAASPLRRTGHDVMDLVALLTMNPEEFAVRFRDTPIKRAKLEGLQRNACVALGNMGDPRAVPALGWALGEGAPLVRGHAAWALGRIGGPEARRMLEAAMATDAEAWVREEVERAIVTLEDGLPALSGQLRKD